MITQGQELCYEDSNHHHWFLWFHTEMNFKCSKTMILYMGKPRIWKSKKISKGTSMRVLSKIFSKGTLMGVLKIEPNFLRSRPRAIQQLNLSGVFSLSFLEYAQVSVHKVHRLTMHQSVHCTFWSLTRQGPLGSPGFTPCPAPRKYGLLQLATYIWTHPFIKK